MKKSKSKSTSVWRSPRGKVAISHPAAASDSEDNEKFITDSAYAEKLVSNHLISIEDRAKAIIAAEAPGNGNRRNKEEHSREMKLGGSVIAELVLNTVEMIRLLGRTLGYGPQLTERAIAVGEMVVMMEIAHQETLHNRKEGRPKKFDAKSLLEEYLELCASGNHKNAISILAKRHTPPGSSKKASPTTIRDTIKRAQKENGN